VNNRDAVLNYFYARDQLGNDYTRIVVDGKVNSLGPDYVVAVRPVKLGDAYDDPLTHIHVPAGNQYIVSAAFLTPLTMGSHTVQILWSSTGSAVKNYQFDGQPVFPPDGWIFNVPTFTVVVH
jgi:hypothetical protein